ncbi:MAG: OsmC family protein [Verrucomicrobia bacterium]|nr:OsmC family protein [Verrucomicrobiota bacterium]
MQVINAEATRNGINYEKQAQIIGLLTDQPALAQVRFRLENTWKNGTGTQSRIDGFYAAGQEHSRRQPHVVTSDMPGVFLGSDDAPTPAEFALHTLASCMNSTMVYNCCARGITVRSSRVCVQGELDAQGYLHISAVDAGFQKVTAVFEIDSDADEAELRELIEAAPMFDVFTRAIPVEVQIEKS